MKSMMTVMAAGASSMAGPCLQPGEAHVWLTWLTEAPSQHAAILSPAERGRAASYDRPGDGRRFEQSRIAVRRILARYLDTEPAEVELDLDGRGRPALAGSATEGGLRISLARTADVALIAVSTSEAGADIEHVEPRPGLGDLAEILYSEAEAGCLSSGCGGSWLHGFYRHWTAREAYLKAVGTGLARLREVELACGPPAAIVERGQVVTGWVVSAIDFSPHHVATVVGRHAVSSCRWLEQ